MNTLLAIEDVSVRFGGIKALTCVSFPVKRGVITAIIGPNGAGKTTLFNCISGFYRPTSGRLVFSAKDTTRNLVEVMGEGLVLQDAANPATVLRKLYYKMFGGSHQVAALGIARTFQNIRLFTEMTVIENLLVAQHRTVDRRIWSGLIASKRYRQAENEALKKAAFWLRAMQLESVANRLAGELPYGHQRRLEIARAMCTGASLICLDEPAAGLNHQETEELARLIRRLRDEFHMTVLLIEHDMTLVMTISDHIVVLDHGEVIAQGTPDAVRKDPAVLQAYLGEEAPL